MSDSTPAGTWGQACLLWLWTNLGGFAGTYIFLNLQVILDHNTHLSDSEMSLIAAIVGLFAAVPSLFVVPFAYVAFRKLPRIAGCWPRLLATAAIITGFFLLIVFIAGKSAMDAGFSLGNILMLGGWTYWASALGAAALVYQHELFRHDESAETVVD